ncbi:hypothetical protein JW905_00090 [bacterium]|nr:hypothetical protein [candidate division CSSED10-310 bacterium]
MGAFLKKRNWKRVILALGISILAGCVDSHEPNVTALFQFLDPDGQPISGVRVFGEEISPLTSDTHGQVPIAAFFEPGERKNFSCHHPEFREERFAVSAPMQLPEKVPMQTIRLERAAFSIEVTTMTHDAAGTLQPLANMVISVDGQVKGTTNAAGRIPPFLFRDLSRGGCVVSAQSQPPAPQPCVERITFNEKYWRYEVVIQCDPAPLRRLVVNMVDKSGLNTAASLAVVVRGEKKEIAIPGSVEFRFREADGEKIPVDLLGGGLCFTSYHREIEMQQDRDEYLCYFSVGRPARVHLRVVDTDGKPLSDVRIKADDRVIGQTREGEYHGTPCVYFAPEEQPVVVLEKEHYEMKAPGTRLIPNTDGLYELVAVMVPQRVLQLVARRAGGAPAAGCMVTVNGPNDYLVQLQTNKKGNLEKLLPRDGVYDVTVYDPVSKERKIRKIATAKMREPIIFNFGGSVSALSVTVQDQEGRPLPGATADLVSAVSEELTEFRNKPLPLERYEAPTGHYLLHLRCGDAYRPAVEHITLSADKETTITVKLYPDLIAHARKLAVEKRYDDAIRLLRQVDQRDKLYYLEALGEIGDCYKATDKGEAAEETYRAMIQLRVDSPTAHFKLANLLLGQGRLLEAVDYFERTISLKGNLSVTERDQVMAMAHLGAAKCLAYICKSQKTGDGGIGNQGDGTAAAIDVSSVQDHIDAYVKCTTKNNVTVTTAMRQIHEEVIRIIGEIHAR